MATVHSTCALDCPDACSLLVTVDNGKAAKLRGNPDHASARVAPVHIMGLDHERLTFFHAGCSFWLKDTAGKVATKILA